MIEEYVGQTSNGLRSLSVAHMVAPPGWGEPWQQPEFHEVTIVLRGQLSIESDHNVIVLGPGEIALAQPGARVRYSNPFDEESEYWAICSPAFSIAGAGRD
ncbi:MAG: cupin domain-containing protein [Bacteroidota bacterium]|nr:cupin domain-containing protein [Bacteroidota bacterium]